MIRTYAAAAAALVAVSATPAAAVTYTYSTVEPFVGGALSFTYETPTFVSDSGFIERSALTNVVGDIQRVRFLASCPFGGGASACDQVDVFAGVSQVIRYFANGAFSANGSYSSSVGAAATLIVSPSANAAVPEPATWALLVLGMGIVGAGLRTRRRSVSFSVA